MGTRKADESPADHFSHVGKHITGGKGAIHNVSDYELTRFACYLIAHIMAIELLARLGAEVEK